MHSRYPFAVSGISFVFPVVTFPQFVDVFSKRPAKRKFCHRPDVIGERTCSREVVDLNAPELIANINVVRKFIPNSTLSVKDASSQRSRRLLL